MLIKFNEAMIKELKKLFDKRGHNSRNPYKLNNNVNDNISDYCLLSRLLAQQNDMLKNK